MRLATTASVPPGTALARDVVVAPTSGPLLRQGVALTDGMRSALVSNGVTRIWVDDELGEGIEPTGLLGELLRRDVLAAVAGMHAEARQALARGGRLDARTLDVLGRWAERIADDVVEAGRRVHDLLDLAPASHYLVHHAVDSAAIAMLVAVRHMTTVGWRQGAATPVRHDAPRAELARLGLGLMLCDVGMQSLPRAVLEDASPLDEAGWEQVRMHPVTGAELLGTNASFVLRGIVRGHHERWGGSGYPDGKAGNATHYLARIAGVADSYDAMTAERFHRQAMSPADAWSAIVAGAGTAFDPGIVAAFREVVAQHPPGTEVTLPDGRTAVVVDVPLDSPSRSTVRVREGAGVAELVVDI
jgi:HD-GYP domain-containing protein (c-di-GMP phosphodiesterase class II)